MPRKVDSAQGVEGRQIPQVYIGGRHIGGAEALERHLAGSDGTPTEAT